MKLYNFVKQSEEQSSELNEETFNLTKFNVKLTKAMLVLAAINARYYCSNLVTNI